MHRLVPVVVLLFAMGSGALGGAAGQGATLMSTPLPGVCTAPPPAANGRNAGTPDARQSATAVDPASEAPLDPITPPPGTPAGPAVLDRIRAAEENISNCFNAGDDEAFVALFTPRAAWSELGVSAARGTPAHSASFLILRETLISVSEAQTHADGRVSAEVVFAFEGDHWRVRDIFVERDGQLLLDEAIELPLAAVPKATPAPLDEATLQALTIVGFMPDEEPHMFALSTGSAFGLQPGETRRLVLGVIDYEVCGIGIRCFVPVPIRAVWAVTPGAGAQIEPATGVLSIPADAANGAVVTVRADVEDGRHEVVAEIYVYTPEANPLLGHWREEAQFACEGGEAVVPAESIEELVFAVDGTFAVTWVPFESYVDYWGTYEADNAQGTLELTVTGGNHIPSDIDGSGRFGFDPAGRLILSDIWLGTPRPEAGPAHCGHRFGG